MGLTERHLFENEDVPENYEWELEDAVCNSCANKKEEFNAKEAQEMIDLWMKDDAPEWIRTKIMNMLYEQRQDKNKMMEEAPQILNAIVCREDCQWWCLREAEGRV